ncbi:MAG: hypothetical protein CL610_06375 [Anaerolineaceae bacterium]|nr:hypothetical protein [Anaerolineaceae bacterium]
MLVSHDHSRVVGWTFPLAVHFEPGIVRSASLTEFYETNEEACIVEKRRLHFYQSLVAQKQEVVDTLKQDLKMYFNGQEQIVHGPQIAFFEKDLASRAFPEVFKLADNDKDGLVPLENLNPIGPGVFQIRQFVIFAHEYFRRALFRLNTLNAEFLTELQNLDKGLRARVALDRDMIGLADDFSMPIELMYVWGPKFDDDLASIQDGVAVFASKDGSERFFSGVSSTEFWWKSDGSQHKFEVEEIADRDHPYYRGEKQFGCRFAHSIITDSTGVAYHLDGAIRMYSEVKMANRLEKRINKAGKHSYYTKIWRIDGEIDTVTWKSLVSSYFRDNTLVGEYLGGVDDNPYLRNMPTGNTSMQDHCGAKYAYIPYSMNAGDGLRVSISYHQVEQPLVDGPLTHHIASNDRLSDGEKEIWILDSRLIDFLKILIDSGASTQKLEEFSIVKFQDGYVNFPTIIHAKDKLAENFDLTQNIIQQVVNIWHAKGLDLVIAYSLGFHIEDRIVLISTMGHLEDIWTWVNSPVSRIPLDKEAIDNWSERIADYLDNRYTPAGDCPPLGNTLKDSGLLAILRQQPQNLIYEYIRDDYGLRLDVNQSSLDQQALDLMQSRQMSLSTGFILHKLTCSNCNSEYAQCECNSLLDSNVGRRIDSCTPLHPHWTDRPNG